MCCETGCGPAHPLGRRLDHRSIAAHRDWVRAVACSKVVRDSPEGFYFVLPSNLNPASRFHLSFNIGYPNAYDRAHGRTGSAIMVHGDCVSIGCYAMTDPVIEEIYTLACISHRASAEAADLLVSSGLSEEPRP